MLKLVNVSKYYSANNNVALGLRNVNVEFFNNEFVTIVGESGSGKTTLLNVISGIDSYEEGEIYYQEQETSGFTLEEWDDFRRNNIAIVFQNFNLIDSYNVIKNVESVLLIKEGNPKQARKRALEIIKDVGLYKQRFTKASKLSGGEKQRVAIARAIASKASILIFDEPTGNLDSETSKAIIELIAKYQENRLILVVTHDYKLFEKYSTRRIRLFDGSIVEDNVIKDHPKNDGIKVANIIQKVKPQILFKVAFNNIISTIKKTIFSLLVMTLLSMVLIVLYDFVAHASMIGSNNNIFPNSNKSRIVLNYYDHHPLSNDDINELEKMNNVDFIYKNDYFLDLNFYLNLDDHQLYGYFQSDKLINSNQLILGRMPNNDLEVVIAQGKNTDQDLTYFIDKSVKIGSKDFTITGVVNNDDPLLYYVTIYGSKALENELKIDKNLQVLKLKLIINNQEFIININNINIVNTLVDDVVVINQEYLKTTDDITKARLKISSIYKRYDYVGLTFSTDYLSRGQIIDINEKTLLKILDNEIYQVSITVKDSAKINQTINALKAKGYFAIAPYYQVGFGAIGAYTIGNMVGMIFLSIVGLLVLYFVSYVILSLIMASKSKDFSIFRILGINNHGIRNLIMMENFILMVASYLIGVFILAIFHKYNIMLMRGLDLFETKQMIITFIILLILSLFMSLKFYQKLIKSTIRLGLVKEKE